MFTHDDILMPLALTVIIDNKVRDPELKAFRRQAVALIPLFDLDHMDEAAVEEWFETHEPQITKTLKARGKNTAILRALTRFSEDVHVENLYDAMVTISISDKEYKREESDLIKSAAAIWGYERPPLKVVE